MNALLAALLLLSTAQIPATPGTEPTLPIRVGSKTFTEGRILGEIMAQLLEAETDLPVERRLGLTGTMICFEALTAGEIDLYAEYTGTGWATILKEEGLVSDPLRTFLQVQEAFEKRFDLAWLMPFGLDNSYALAVREDVAESLGIERISDLLPHASSLKAGLSLEFYNREDGYPGLAKAYGLKLGQVRAMDHGLAYEALAAKEIDLVDAYTTDGKLLRYKLRILADDRGFFPPYHAAPLVRGELLRRHPEVREVLHRLAFRIDDKTIQGLNYEVEAEGKSYEETSRGFLTKAGLVSRRGAEAQRGEPATTPREEQSFLRLMSQRWRKTLSLAWEHIVLTAVAVLLATLFAVPLGIACTRFPTLRRVSLWSAGILQTIPSLALLAFMISIPSLGLGVRSAIAALFLYGILPILRNAYTGIAEVDADLIEAARAIGLSDRQVLTKVELPLSIRTIMAGIRTSAVISVGVATLAAFIGAGGLGEPIVTGLSLNDSNLILSGALPAAGLAVLTDWLLGKVETALSPPGAPG